MKKFLGIRIVLAVLLVLFVSMTLGCYEVSSGDRIGRVTKLSQRGFMIKTWEGDMFTSAKGSTSAPFIWHFSVEDKKLGQAIQDAKDSCSDMKLTYSEEWIVSPIRAESKYLVTGFKCLN